ncbi:Gfo/Idh/MocA family oxidoreductase [Clostridium sp. BNL1100]|uniref:Gfo/Idh/MocA family protein n=1 Tax=Clostridium sp. BNL1100 TaxID=755731 RepID=UPI00024A7AD0|nr:Gfo/Idh/MocA family oxidoreductase [Clostridium sp. BNL1100]AEY67448.1 putative dehydrogenase [Clostridium sp. BNL1100]
MKIGIVGCGFVSNFYGSTMPNHPELEIAGVADINRERAVKFAEYYNTTYYNSVEELLNKKEISIILNCTNPHSHYEVSKACLLANKHVYTEKPMGLNFREAAELVSLAKERNLNIASSPNTVLGEYTKGLIKALNEKEIGKPILAYSQLDDGPIHQMRYWSWVSKTGVPWPYENEFKVGSVLEHAGYTLSLLTILFGPAKTIQSYTNCLVPNKLSNSGTDNLGPDYSESCIEFHSGVVARVTIGSVAPNNHSLLITGEEGVLSMDDLYWNVRQKIYIQKRVYSNSTAFENSHEYLSEKLEYQFEKTDDFIYKTGTEVNVDWAKGVLELAESVTQNRRCLLDMDHALHVMEILDLIQNSKNFSGPQKITTTFDPVIPIRWMDEKRVPEHAVV